MHPLLESSLTSLPRREPAFRRSRPAGRADFSPVQTRMLSTVSAIGYTWISASVTRNRPIR